MSNRIKQTLKLKQCKIYSQWERGLNEEKSSGSWVEGCPGEPEVTGCDQQVVKWTGRGSGQVSGEAEELRLNAGSGEQSQRRPCRWVVESREEMSGKASQITRLQRNRGTGLSTEIWSKGSTEKTKRLQRAAETTWSSVNDPAKTERLPAA